MSVAAPSRSSWQSLQALALSASLGEGLLLAALPLLAAALTSDPQAVALVTVSANLPWVLLPLGIGVVIDRIRKSLLLSAGLGLQAVSAVALLAAAYLGVLSIPSLMVIAFLLVVGQVVVESTQGALVPAVVGMDRLASANSRLLIIDMGVARFLAPPLAGFAVVAGHTVLGWLVVAGMVAALGFSTRLRAGDDAPAAAEGRVRPLAEIREGLRYLLRSGLLRSITIAVSTGAFAWAMGYAVFVLYAQVRLGLDARGYGLLVSCMAAGFVAGSLVAGRLTARFGFPAAMRGAALAESSAKLMLGLIPAHWAAVAGVLFLQSFATFVWNVGSQSCRQRFTPKRLLGRVLTSHRALSWGAAPLGVALGGFVAVHRGLQAVWLVAAAIQIAGLAVAWRFLSPAGFARAQEQSEAD